MKNITINEQEFGYHIFETTDEHNGSYCYTEFYKGVDVYKSKKYLFFGPTVSVEIPKVVFKVDIDIENPIYTKERMKEIIENAAAVFYRQQEIERGEII